MIEQIYRDRKKWLRIAMSFGLNKQDAEDVLSHMYLKIYQKLKKGYDISYEDGYNHMYVYKVIKSKYIDLYRKKQRIKTMLSMRFDNDGDVVFLHSDGQRHMKTKPKKIRAEKNLDYDLFSNEYKKILNKLKNNKNSSLYKLQQHVHYFEEINNMEKPSFTNYCKLNNVKYREVYNGYHIVKDILKNEMLELI
jgi:DNA-directed RNA polymerase specialized sigma24 family protein